MKYYQNALKIIDTKFSNPIQYSHIAIILKDRRIKQNQTLEMVSYQICTPATLSKIESGTLSPSENLLNQLLNRLNLKKISPTPTHPYQWLNSFKQHLEQGSRNDLETIYHLKSESYPYQIVLKQFVINLTLDEPKITSKQYDYLLHFQIYMSIEECILFYHYVGLYYLKLKIPSLAIKYYHLSFQLSQKSGQDVPLLHLHLAQYYFKINQSIRVISHLNDALTIFSSRYLIKYTIECELLLCEEYIKNELLNKANPLISKLYHQLQHHPDREPFYHILNLVGDYYLKIKDYKQAEQYYKKAIDLNDSPLISLCKLLELYHQSNQYSKQISLIEQVKQHSNLPKDLEALTTYYDFLFHNPTSDLFRIFLLKEAIPTALKYGHYADLERYSDALIKFYLENGKYKLAFQTQHKLIEYQQSYLLTSN